MVVEGFEEDAEIVVGMLTGGTVDGIIVGIAVAVDTFTGVLISTVVGVLS